MPHISLASLSIFLGLAYLIPQLYGFFKPADFGKALRQFPRSNTWGYCLIGLATLWFLTILWQENISDFAAYKKFMLFGFGALGLTTCLFVKDFLAIRGYAILLLLIAKWMIDVARWVDSEWRLVIVCWAYLWVLGGMWFSISPWRVRDLILWKTASEARIRLICCLRGIFGMFIIGLGIFAF